MKHYRHRNTGESVVAGPIDNLTYYWAIGWTTHSREGFMVLSEQKFRSMFDPSEQERALLVRAGYEPT